MAVSDVTICNLALQKLGAKRINMLTEDSRNARSCNACYEPIRDKVMQHPPWNFAIKRFTLAASATAPEFEYLYAFPFPVGALRLLIPNRMLIDWVVEQQGGQRVILTNDGASIQTRFVVKVEDPTLYHPLFVEALACKLAWHMCEEITQSDTKKNEITVQYKDCMSEARLVNAFERSAAAPPEDKWLMAQRMGTCWMQE